MKDEQKSRQLLIAELRELRAQNLELKEDLRQFEQKESPKKNIPDRLQSLLEKTSDSIFCYEYNPPIPTCLPLKDQIQRLYEGTLAECNKKCARAYGFKRAGDVIGKKLTELFGATEGSLDNLFTTFIKNGYQAIDEEEVEILPDGTKRYYLNSRYGVLAGGELTRIWGKYRDITDYKQAEEELRNSEERLKILFEYAPDAYYLYDLEGRFIDGNLRAEKISGYKRKELIGKSFLKLKMLPEEQYFKAAEALKKSAEGKSTGPEEYTFIRKDGNRVMVEISTHPIKIDDQVLVLAIAHDITDRKRAEEELQKRETHQALVLNSLPMSFYTAYPYGDYGGTWVSNQIHQISGFSPQQFLTQTDLWASRLHPDDRDRALQEFETLKEKGTIQLEYRWQSAHGKYLWILDNAVLVKDTKGTPKEIIGTWLDITERKEAEERINETLKMLDKSEEKLRLAIEATTDGLWDWDIKTGKVEYNPSWAKMMGETSIKQEYETWESRINPEDKETVLDSLRNHLAGKTEKWQCEHRLQASDGNWKWVIGRGQIVNRDEKNNPLRMIGTMTDISESKKAEKKIKASLIEKEILLREIHHRVKNNMQIITSLLRLQARSLKDPEVVDLFTTSQNRIKSMALIHESLYRSKDMARINFSDYLRKITVHLFTAYRKANPNVQLQIKSEDCHLDISQAIPCGQIINELVSNVLKHAFPKGKKGELLIEMHQEPEGKFHLTVADNGIGFPQDLDFLNTETLGLQLVTDLVRQLKGTIQIRRKKGTEFQIDF